MPTESIEVPVSEGNEPAPAAAEPTPSPETPPVDPAANPDPAPTAEPELFELPDGRKVDAETLAKEWKDNFAPEFTRKSQELAQLKNGTLPSNPTVKSPLADPNWTPQSYAELVDIAKQSMKEDLEAKEQARIEQQAAIENEVVSQLTEIKKSDPTLNENALFLHANKYGFRDLRVAHKNMQDMGQLAKNVQKTTVNNITKRNDPVSVVPGATGTAPNPANFSNAIEFLRSIKK